MRDAASKLGVCLSSLHRYLCDCAEIEGSVASDRKRARTGKAPNVETAITTWISTAREKNAPSSGPLVKLKAEEFAKKINKPDFKATNSWFCRFKKRECLVHKKLHGKGEAADVESRVQWLNGIWPDLRKRFNEEDIWNTDESGIFIRALPDATLTFANDNRKGGKQSKERITALFTCSMTGEKRKIFVIGKSQKPRCLNGVKSLPVKYAANKSAWMTAVLPRFDFRTDISWFSWITAPPIPTH